MDPRGGLKTNVKLSISPACHPERSREIVVIRGQGFTLSPHMPRTSPLSSSVFHAIVTLSAPAGHLPLEGKAAMRDYHPLKKGGEAASIQQSSLHFGRDDKWKTGNLT